MKREKKNLNKKNTNTLKVLKTYGSASLRGIDRALHTAQEQKLHKLSYKLRVPW